MSSDILFDNLIITDDVEVARDFAANSFDIKRRYIDRESVSLKPLTSSVFPSQINTGIRNRETSLSNSKKTFWHRLMRRMNYKPGWWALYFVYLLIPASCYVFYLYRRAKEVGHGLVLRFQILIRSAYSTTT